MVVELLLIHSRNVLARSLLELATSFLGVQRLRQEKLLAFRKLFAGSHPTLFNKRIQKSHNVVQQNGGNAQLQQLPHSMQYLLIPFLI